jgi:signal transduction histidine kinase
MLAKATRDRLGRAWGATHHWFAANTFAPRWALGSLRARAFGYLVAMLLQIVAVAFMLFLVQRFGAFPFQDAPELLAIALVALNWGAGPSVVATVFGALLINYVVLTPHFAFTFSGAREAVELVIFLAVGIAISVVASQTERERRAGIALAARLATEQARLETIIESAPDMISIHDAVGTLVRRNRIAQQVAPHARGDERLDEAQQAYALFTLDDHPLAMNELPVARALRGEEVQNLEVLAHLPDGDRILSVSAAAFRDAWGAILGAVAITHDVTPLRRSERQAAERAAQLEAIFDALVDGMVVLDPGGRLTYMNEAMRRLIGLDAAPSYYELPLDERITRLRMRGASGEPLPPARWPQRRVLDGEVLVGPEADDYLLHTLDGREVRVNINGAPMRNEHGAIAGGLLILRDVTEQRRLETRTHEALVALLTVATTLVEAPADASEEGAHVLAQRLIDLTRSVLGCRRVSISLRDPATDVLHTLAVAGLSPEQERHWWAEQKELERRGTRFSDGSDQGIVARLRAGEVMTFDLTQPPYDTLPNPYDIRTALVAPMCIADTLVGLLSYDYGSEEHAYAPSERLVAGGVARLAALVLERERLLREAAEVRGRALALERASARMDEFLGIASHELKTPLTTIKANVQLTDRRLRRLDPAAGDLAEQLRRALPVGELMERTQRQVDRLDRLVGDLLDVSRIRAGKLDLRLEPCDLAALVRDAVQEQRLAWPGRQITLVLPDKPVLVEADPDRIGQVVTNYLTNALKYSPDEAPVQVALTVEWDAGATEFARVAVRDKGPGLPEEEQEQIWERFHRVPGIEVQSGSGVGLGLGLHISREIVQRHGGAVGVEGAVGAGSTFWFTLPLADAA